MTSFDFCPLQMILKLFLSRMQGTGTLNSTVKKLNISVIILFTLFQSNISQHQCIEFNFVEFVDALALTRILGSGSLSVTQAISKGVFSQSIKACQGRHLESSVAGWASVHLFCVQSSSIDQFIKLVHQRSMVLFHSIHNIRLGPVHIIQQESTCAPFPVQIIQHCTTHPE